MVDPSFGGSLAVLCNVIDMFDFLEYDVCLNLKFICICHAYKKLKKCEI